MSILSRVFRYQNAANAGESGMTAKVAYRRLRNHLPVLSFECHHSEACRQKRACRSIPPPGLIMSTIVRNMRAMPTKDPSGNVGRGMPEYDRSLLLFITIARSRMPAKAAGCQSRWAYLVSVTTHKSMPAKAAICRSHAKPQVSTIIAINSSEHIGDAKRWTYM